MSGDTVGNYRLVDKLGEGGMGAVYKGVDLMVEREVAIKMLRPDIARQAELVERFRAEAVALAKLNHPNIATLYSFFREGDEYYMVMEFVRGQTLDTMIRSSPPPPIEQTIAIASQVLDAIEHAHTFGILHRDIKPANIMVTPSGQVKVTDFGIARVLGTTRMTREGCVCGTLEYLAPERIRGQEADVRSDLYSMGIVLYEMLTRHLPFESKDTYELMRAHLEKNPPPFATFAVAIPANIEATVRKALAKAPEERFGSPHDFRAALTAAVERPAIEPLPLAEPLNLAPGLPPTYASASATEIPSVPATSSPRHWKIYAAGAIALIVIVLAVALAITRAPRPAALDHRNDVPATAQPAATEVKQGPAPEANGATDTAATEPAATSRKTEIQKPNKPIAAALKATQTDAAAADGKKRKAALDALEKEDAAKKTDPKGDRKKSSLKALEN